MKSIIQDTKECFACGRTDGLQLHHCIGGRHNRANSDKYGLTIWLCMEHHTGASGVHNNPDFNLEVKKIAEMHFLINHTFDEYMAIFGKNYLEELC